MTTPDVRSSQKHHVLETATASVKFTGFVLDGDDSDSSSSASCNNGPVHSRMTETDTHAEVSTNLSHANQHQEETAVERSGTCITSELGQRVRASSENVMSSSPNVNSEAKRPCLNDDHSDSQDSSAETKTATASFTKPYRFNPFAKEDFDEEDNDLFPQLKENSELSTQEEGDPVLPVKEDYFSEPEGFISLSSIEDLEKAIAECKEKVLYSQRNSESRKNYTHKLIQLRLKLAEAKEKSANNEECVRVTGHRFVLKGKQRSQRYCEQCNASIWYFLQAWYRCEDCGFCCHMDCLNLVRRTCAYVKVQEGAEYILSICPETTLAAQNYKCAECRTDISFHISQQEPRLCDYNGNWFCNHCHWNDSAVIPARVLHNWDFEPQKICRASKQFLKLMQKKAVLRVADINPMLFNFVEELNDVKKIREEILIMKQYFLSCKGALKSKLLLQLKDRQHFVDNSDMYSLADLIDVVNDVLLPELIKIHANFAQHIKTDCSFCQAKGNVCSLCDEKEVLFPFDNIAIVCSVCSTVLHRHCYMTSNQRCPTCSSSSDLEC